MKYRILLILMGLSLLPVALISATLSVKQDGSGDYTIIQEALDAANPGDTVLVHPGRYYENLEIDKSHISLMSLEGVSGDSGYIDTTIIDGTGSVGGILVCQYKTGIYIRGFSITKGIGSGLSLAASSVSTIINCKIFERASILGGGVNIGGATVTLSGVEIFNNYAQTLGGGIFGTEPTGHHTNIIFDPINRCSIYNNRAGSGQDIYIQHAANDLELPLDTFSVANPSSYHAIYLSEAPFYSDYQINFDIQNAHYQELDCDIYVSTTGSDYNDGISPATALKTIHEAIYRVAADSLNQNTVHILPGEYSRTANNQIFPIALKGWVKVQGNGIDDTSVVGEPHPEMDSNGTAIIFLAPIIPQINLSNLSVTARDFNCFCYAIHASLTVSEIHLSNIRIHDITYDGYDNQLIAIVILGMTGEKESTFKNVTIENSGAGAVKLLNIASRATSDRTSSALKGSFDNCVFRNTSNTESSLSVSIMSPISILANEELIFRNCEFTNLSMMDDDSRCIQIGGIQYPRQQNHFVFQNCLFSGNESEGSIGIIGSSNNPRIDITNCTFAGNTSDNYILMVNGEVSITNSIFYNDSPYEIKVNPMDYNPNEYTHLKIDHSLIKGGIDGIIPYPRPGNTINFLPSSFDADPLFQGIVNPSNRFNYVLSESYPSIDSGTMDISGLNLPPYDLAGNWRVWNNRIDMGCFEYASEPWVSNDDHVIPQVQHFVLHQNYPNPFNPETTISFELAEPDFVSIEIFNTRGQKIRKLLNRHYGTGQHNVAWDGCDEQGRAVSSGVYFYRMQTAQKSLSRKMLLLK